MDFTFNRGLEASIHAPNYTPSSSYSSTNSTQQLQLPMSSAGSQRWPSDTSDTEASNLSDLPARLPSRPRSYHSSTTSSTSSQTPSLPVKAPRRRPDTLRLIPVGIDPSGKSSPHTSVAHLIHPTLHPAIVGKTLTRIRRSAKHPTLTLDFSDKSTFQVLVDGYDPVHRGVPKGLEMDPSLDHIFNPPNGELRVNLVVADCALITLTDKAFEQKGPLPNATGLGKELQWDQNHLGVAFKFADQERDSSLARWHCVWAKMEEHDEALGGCVFRSYDDVYLERLQRRQDTGPATAHYYQKPSYKDALTGSSAPFRKQKQGDPKHKDDAATGTGTAPHRKKQEPELKPNPHAVLPKGPAASSRNHPDSLTDPSTSTRRQSSKPQHSRNKSATGPWKHAAPEAKPDPSSSTVPSGTPRKQHQHHQRKQSRSGW